MDPTKSIEQLENDFWKDQSSYVSSVVQRCHEVRKIPLKDLSIEDVRVLISQNMSLEISVPLAIDELKKNILVEAEFYPGDLLFGIVKSNKDFWLNQPELWNVVTELLIVNYDRITRLQLGRELERDWQKSLPAFLRYHQLPNTGNVVFQADIPPEKISSVAPYISLAYIGILRELTNTPIVSETSSETIEDQGFEIGRKILYGDKKLGISLTSRIIESSAGIHGEDSTWKFYGLPSGIELIGYSRIDYRGIGQQYIWLVASSTNVDLLIKTSTSFTNACKTVGL